MFWKVSRMAMGKFGCVAPSVVQLPWDLHSLLPDGLQAAVVTLNNRNGLSGEKELAVLALRRAVDVLIDEGAQAIVVMGVPMAARFGHATERETLTALTRDRGEVPIVSSLHACIARLSDLGVRRPLFITQYNAQANEAIVRYARDAGADPAGVEGLGAANAEQVNALAASDFAALARQALGRHPQADGIFVAARGNLLDVTRTLERELGVPVIEQMQGTVWWARQCLDDRASPSTPT